MNNKFNYTYSSPSKDERKEIESIRSQYLEKSERELKLEKFKKLDNKVKNVPTLIALIIGFVGTMIFGLGLTMVLEWAILVWGIVVMVIGIVPMSLAYFAYSRLSKNLKSKYSKEILNLSNELLNEKENNN